MRARRAIPPNVIACPKCPKCGLGMTLVLILPDEPGRDRRVYECSRCEHEISETCTFRRAG
jgi:hypothetical protein